MIDRLGNQPRIATTQLEAATQPAAQEKSIPIEIAEQFKPLSVEDSAIRKGELSFGGSTMAAILNSKLGQVAKPDLVSTPSSDPVQGDPAFQKLPETTKQQVLTDLRNAPDENAKANIRKLTTDPSFGSISPQTQKEALQSLGEEPGSDVRLNSVRQTCKDMERVEQMPSYKSLPEDTQAHFRVSMFHFSGNESVRDGLINFAQNDSFGKLASPNQKRVIDAYLANPSPYASGNSNSLYLGNMIASPAFQKMDDAEQAQVLGIVRDNSTDEKSVQSVDKLLHDSNFEQISPASQKAALEDLAENPASDAHMRGVHQTCSDMVHLENSPDFRNLPRDTQSSLRTLMFQRSGNETARDGLIGFVHNSNFAKLSSDNQQRLMGAYLTTPTLNNSAHLNNMIGSPAFQNMDAGMQQRVITIASRNSSNEQNMQNIDKLLRDSNFEKLPAASQGEALTAMERLVDDPNPDAVAKGVRQTCSDMIHMENSPNFRNLPPDSQAALRRAMFNNSDRENVRSNMVFLADNPEFAKMSAANQQRTLGAYLTNPTDNNSSYINNVIGSPAFQNMDEEMQQRVITLASRNSSNEPRMKELSDLLRDPAFVNASREDQFNQLRPFENHDPNLEL